MLMHKAFLAGLLACTKLNAFPLALANSGRGVKFGVRLTVAGTALDLHEIPY
jgi:hypothetical protein